MAVHRHTGIDADSRRRHVFVAIDAGDHFNAERLADFKVPRKILILDEIPKGATGKLQRIGLAEKLGLGS